MTAQGIQTARSMRVSLIFIAFTVLANVLLCGCMTAAVQNKQLTANIQWLIRRNREGMEIDCAAGTQLILEAASARDSDLFSATEEASALTIGSSGYETGWDLDAVNTVYNYPLASGSYIASLFNEKCHDRDVADQQAAQISAQELKSNLAQACRENEGRVLTLPQVLNAPPQSVPDCSGN